MYLTLNHPALLPLIRELRIGYFPIRMPDGKGGLILKVNKEIIATARNNNSFKIYCVPSNTDPQSCVGLVSAFFDDADEPLVIMTPLSKADPLSSAMNEMLRHREIQLFFFDEHNREMLSVEGTVNRVNHQVSGLPDIEFSNANVANVRRVYSDMDKWFATRTLNDDSVAITIELGVRLFRDDFMLFDLTGGESDHSAISVQPWLNTIDREEPGHFQEHDIAHLLYRLISAEDVFLNPIRKDNGKEIADLIVLAGELLIVIQAKDSPNTSSALSTSISRKKTTILKHIYKAARQIGGAIRYLDAQNKIQVRNVDCEKLISTSNKRVFGIIVVRELFDDDFQACSAPVLRVAAESDTPCILLSYNSLHEITHHSANILSFFEKLDKLFDVAASQGQFPKPLLYGKRSTIPE